MKVDASAYYLFSGYDFYNSDFIDSASTEPFGDSLCRDVGCFAKPRIGTTHSDCLWFGLIALQRPQAQRRRRAAQPVRKGGWGRAKRGGTSTGCDARSKRVVPPNVMVSSADRRPLHLKLGHFRPFRPIGCNPCPRTNLLPISPAVHRSRVALLSAQRWEKYSGGANLSC
jgi:hypothetical protein